MRQRGIAGGCRRLRAGCCLLRAGCCLLRPGCCLLRARRCLLRPGRRLLRAAAQALGDAQTDRADIERFRQAAGEVIDTRTTADRELVIDLVGQHQCHFIIGQIGSQRLITANPVRAIFGPLAERHRNTQADAEIIIDLISGEEGSGCSRLDHVGAGNALHSGAADAGAISRIAVAAAENNVG